MGRWRRAEGGCGKQKEGVCDEGEGCGREEGGYEEKGEGERKRKKVKKIREGRQEKSVESRGKRAVEGG